MDRDNEAFQRRVAESVNADAAGDSSDEEEQTHVVRQGATRAIDADELELRHDATLADDSTATRLEADTSASSIDSRHERPPDLSEVVQVTEVAPDGTSTGRAGLTSATGEALGGGGLSGQIQSRAGELGGDALGRGLDFDPLSGTSDRDLGRMVAARDGSRASMDVEFGEITDLTPKPMTVEFGEITDLTPKPMGVEFGDIVIVNPAGSGDEIIDPGYAKPDPTGGHDVITGESIAAATKLNDPGVYAQPTQDGDDSGGTAAAVERAAALNDPQQVTNYGPDGPQAVQVGADWAPPVDTLFDPPSEGGSADMAGAHSAMADSGAALSGSIVGSSTPEAPPDPPPTPPGDDPGGDPWGPPPEGGESHGP